MELFTLEPPYQLSCQAGVFEHTPRVSVRWIAWKMVQTCEWKLVIKRHRSLLGEGVVLCFSTRSLLFFWRDYSAMAGRIFTKSLPADVFVVLLVNGGTHENISGWKRLLWSENSDFRIQSSDGRCEEEGELWGDINKWYNYNIIIIYHHIYVWWNSVRGISVIRAQKLCILCRHYQHGTVLQSHGM